MTRKYFFHSTGDKQYKRKSALRIVFFLFILLTSYSYSLADNDVAETDFVILHLKTQNCPPEIGIQFASIIKKIISDEKTYRVITDTRPIASLAAKYPGIIIINGSISGITVKRETEVSRYAVKDANSKKYRCVITTTNSRLDSIDLTFDNIYTGAAQLDRGAKSTGKKIWAYYLSRKPVVPHAEKIIPENRQDEVKKKEPSIEPLTSPKPDSPDSFPVPKKILFAPSYLHAVGSFSHTLRDGFGAEVSVQETFRTSYTAGIHFAAYSMRKANHKRIDSAQAVSPFLSAGYQFSQSAYLVEPFLCAGYFIHSIRGAKDVSANTYSRNTYYNPTIGGGVAIYYSIAPSWEVFMKPSYMIFIQKKTASQYIRCNFGIGWRFD